MQRLPLRWATPVRSYSGRVAGAAACASSRATERRPIAQQIHRLGINCVVRGRGCRNSSPISASDAPFRKAIGWPVSGAADAHPCALGGGLPVPGTWTIVPMASHDKPALRRPMANKYVVSSRMSAITAGSWQVPGDFIRQWSRS